MAQSTATTEKPVMKIKITNPNHMLCSNIYEVVEVEEIHYIIRFTYNNALVRIFKTDAEEIQE